MTRFDLNVFGYTAFGYHVPEDRLLTLNLNSFTPWYFPDRLLVAAINFKVPQLFD